MQQQHIRIPSAIRGWWEESSCHSNGCAVSWRVWRRMRGRRVKLNGAALCFPTCFQRELRRQLEGLLPGSNASERFSHRIPLGLLMLSRGDIDQAQLRASLNAQRNGAEGKIGEWIQRLGFARESEVIAALGAQWGCPVMPSRISVAARETRIPIGLLRAFRMAPVSYVATARTMHVAFADRINYSALLAIEQALACQAQACVCSARDLERLLDCLEERQARHRSDREFAAATTDEMTRIASSYVAMLSPCDVRPAGCNGFIWLRVEAGSHSVNLVFTANPDHRALAS